MLAKFKRVPAVDKSFAMIELLAKSSQPLGISHMADALGYHKSTVFNLAHTLADLGILQNNDGKFALGLGLYLLAKVSRDRSDLIQIVHPYLERLCAETNLTVFLGMRTGLKAVILDKVDSPVDLKISSDIGIRIPILAGAAGKALLCQMPEEELDLLLSQISERNFARFTKTTKEQYKKILAQARRQGIATDYGEYIEGIGALAVPLGIGQSGSPLAIWAVGLKSQVKGENLGRFGQIMKEIAQAIRANLVS